MNKTHNQDDKMSKQFKTNNGFRRSLFQYVLMGLLLIGMVSIQGCFSSGEDEIAGTSGNSATGGAGTNGGTGTNDQDVGASSDAKMVLLTDTLTMPSGDSGSVRITANLKSAKNVLMTGEKVDFGASSGTMQVLSDTTDELGNAVVVLSSPNSSIPRTITVTATGGGSTSTIDIKVAGTTLEVNGPSKAIAWDQATELTVKLKAGDGSVLKDKDIVVVSRNLNVFTQNGIATNTIKTNEQGEASIVVTDSARKNDEITFSALNKSVEATFTLLVSADSLSFNSPKTKADINLGESHPVKVKLVRGGSPISGVAVSFSSTRGTLTNISVQTDSEGVASVQLSSNNAGGAIITASTDKEESTLEVEFVATNPDTLNLEAAPKQVSMGQTSTLTATVRDPDLNLVKNKKVSFRLAEDFTNGTLSKGDVFTNSFGQASSVYTAGSQPSGNDGVKVEALVVGTAVKNDTRLTVEPQNVRIIFGTGSKMFENGPAQYRVPYSIQVSDDGRPVAGVAVSISAFPTAFYRGKYVPIDIDGNGEADQWAPNYSVSDQNTLWKKCPSEDLNKNGILDPGEQDKDEDGYVTPPAVITAGPSPDEPPTVSNSTVTTDVNGFGYFSIYYPREFANWVEVKLVAQTTQAGRESTFSVTTTPPAFADDVNDIKISPPAPNGSPFGVANHCNKIP